MIGIFAIAGWPPSQLAEYGQKIAKSMRSNELWHTDVYPTSLACCGRVGPLNRNNIWTSEDGSKYACIDGYCIDENSPNGAVSAQQLAESVIAGDQDSLFRYRGEFSAFVLDLDRRQLYVVSDHFGTRVTYWNVNQGKLIVTSQLNIMFQLGLLPAKLNHIFVSALLRYNKCRLGNHTLFDHVFVVASGTIQQFDLDELTAPKQTNYYTHTLYEETRSVDDWIDTIMPHMRRATSNVMKRSGTTALALSGGLDSRMILAALDPQQRRDVISISCGLPDSSEVKLAQQAANLASSPYYNVDLDAHDFVTWSQTNCVRNEEFDIFVQGAQGALHQFAAQQASTLMTGWDIDVPLRGTYLNESVFSMESTADVNRVINEKWGLFSRQELHEILQPSFARETLDALDSWLFELLDLLPAQTALQRYLLFVFQYEKRRLLMLRNRMIRWEIDSTLPFYDTTLQKVLMAIPEALKLNNRLFADVFRRLAPELATIPYQRTMLPPNVPVEYWEKGAAIEKKREELYHEIYYETGARIPYRRYYSNFNEWLSDDKNWREFSAELLQSSSTLVTQQIVQDKVVERLINEHQSGQRSHQRKLIYLMSLELYLRTYFD